MLEGVNVIEEDAIQCVPLRFFCPCLLFGGHKVLGEEGETQES